MPKFFRFCFPVVVLIAAALASAVSCEETNPENTGITISEQTVSSEAGFRTVTVRASGRWILSLLYEGEDDGWASLTTTSGRGGKDDIILRYDENSSGQSRSLRVVLTVSDHDYAATFIQRAASMPETGPGWLELPAIKESDRASFYSHDMTLSSGANSRNYSFLYDREHLVSHWVAYPLNAGLIGAGTRTDDWGYDPAVPEEDQPRLDRGFSGGRYDRGHQLPSADRLVRNANVQTFYFTNMTPQMSRFNQQIWASLETMVRNYSNSADTLYVVTGCVLDGSSRTAYDNDGREVTVPVAYYKALLWYNSESTYSSKYLSAGFYLSHQEYSESAVTSDMCMSIDELESITGIDFFVNLPERVGTSTAAAIEAQDPANFNGLWKL